MNLCLSSEQVERYLSGNCSEDERQAIETHITDCENCQQQIESVRLTKGISSESDLIQTRDIIIDCNTEDKYSTKTILPTPSNSRTPSAFGEPSVSTFEGYEILEQLPPGGQALVYKAIQKATKRVVALKVLLQGAQISLPAQYRFEREVDLAASLQHPNIVTIYDSGIAKGQYYFAMQYIEGKPLDKYIQSEKLSIRQTMELFNHVCSAVAYAHQRGVMHRDLKPGNILVDADGQPHILDFGLAKLTDGSEPTSPEMRMTSIPGKVMGTLAFMSPEQASAQPDAVDVRTDVYSIGVILYRILTDSFPYDITGSMLAILRNIQEAEPTRPSKILPRFNSEVEAILLKALAKDPAVRYQSAAHMAQDIDCWLKGLPISARSDSSIYLLGKLLIRHRYASAVVGLLALIVLSFSWFSFDQYLIAKKALKESEASLKAMKLERNNSLALTRRLQLTIFLESWHKDQSIEIQRNAKYITTGSKGSKEDKAVGFLRNPRPLTEKEGGFRQSLLKDYTGFVDVIIGEHHLKDGNRKEAIKAYRDSYNKALQHYPDIDRWVLLRTQARLNELAAGDEPMENMPTVGGRD
jgi:serine/threonine protein kinase